MKRLTYLLTLALFFASGTLTKAQEFDFYGPAPFGEILERSFGLPWTPFPIEAIQNREYVILLDAATKSKVVMQDATDITVLNVVDAANVTATYGSLMRSIFQIVDINTHLDQQETPLSGEYQMNPMLHSYFGINASSESAAYLTDGGTRYIAEEEHAGYVLLEFGGTAESTTIKAISGWEYSAALDSVVEVGDWMVKWLKIDGTALSWTTTEGEATAFYMADATDLIALKIEDGSDFNPVSISYQPNATAALPEVPEIDDSPILRDIAMEIADEYDAQLGTTSDATAAATAKLDEIETTLTNNGASLRYPKAFYLALRQNMLSHTFASTDVYNGKLGYNLVPHVYFTNATDDDGVPHPFMVVISHAASARPNLLVDVNRPPGSMHGVGYSETPVTRHGKLGEFALKIPLKDYGLIDNLLDNDLSPYGDLASDFDMTQGTTTVQDQYNYAGLASIGVAVDGVTIYPAQNNNLRFAVSDAEVTHSGIHVGGGLELHYHADGHAFSGNGINLYNFEDYDGHNHPPVIGMGHDGIALFAKYEANYPMIGDDTALDIFGGHDHGDGFGYHYHAHTETVETVGGPGDTSPTTFDEHFLMVGAWKGRINDIPGFDQGKMNQFRDDAIARYAGAEYDPVGIEDQASGLPAEIALGQNYPNPFNPSTMIRYQLPVNSHVELKVFDLLGREVATLVDGRVSAGYHEVSFNAPGLSSGLYIYRLVTETASFQRRMTLIK